MLRIIVCIAAVLYVLHPASASEKPSSDEQRPLRQSSRTCDEPTEEQRIARFADKVSRRGDELLLQLKDGTTITKKITPGDWPGYYDCDGNLNVRYEFYDFIDPWYVVKEYYPEGRSTLLINRDTGTEVRGNGNSEFAPGDARFLTTGAGEGDDEVESWALGREGIVREWIIEHGTAYRYQWIGPSTVEVSGPIRPDGNFHLARLKLHNTGWRCSGASEICGKLEILSYEKDDADVSGVAKPSRRVAKRDPKLGKVLGTAPGSNKRGATKSKKDSSDADLIKAASEGDVKRVNAALKKSARIDATDEGGWTPLTRAVAEGHPDMVKLLLKQGARVMPEDAFESPLALAVRRSNLAMAKLLLDSGADVNAQGANGRTPLVDAALRDQPEMVKTLLSAGADPNARDENCSTVLHLALNIEWRDKAELARLLLEHGADINVRNKYGRTALQETAIRGSLAVAEVLLEKGADLNAKDKHGRTALMLAVGSNRAEMVELLLDNSADINPGDDHGWTALTWAASVGQSEMVMLLRNHGAEMTLAAAACLGDLRNVQRLLREGSDVNAKGANGRTALMGAVGGGHVEVVKVLLEKGAEINAKDSYCWTALHIAQNERGKAISKDIVDLLKARGAKE